MRGLDDWREHPRVDIDGAAFWSAGRNEGSCTLRNLSLGGVSIRELRSPLRVGTKLRVALVIGDTRLESVPATVVRISARELAFCFGRLSPELKGQLEELLRKLMGSI